MTAVNGYRWALGVTDNAGRALFLLTLFGGPIIVVAWRSYPPPLVLTGSLLVLLVVAFEGAYRTWVEAVEHPAISAAPVAQIEPPFRLEHSQDNYTVAVYRLPFHYEGTEDLVKCEAHFEPSLKGRELLIPAIHLLRKVVPDPRMGAATITLRHGQTAYLDLVGIQVRADNEPQPFAIDVITWSDGEQFREYVKLDPGEYTMTLRILYSLKPHDERKFAIKVAAVGTLAERLVLEEKP